ncbi:conserved hypothetical protein [Methylocella silvestris BL2]|uniref:Uncharacterized protein n=2 Tax=Methylocella silvestris TaxID=199596 RepID=B8EJ46_METSB|nr:conserved hypothetical protein [Methylocella silvestris BL2]
MKRFILAASTALVMMGAMAASVEEAGAVVCARGVYRAGCAGPNGAVVARRGVYARPVYGARRVYAPRGVYRRY